VLSAIVMMRARPRWMGHPPSDCGGNQCCAIAERATPNLGSFG
jgi:hypothetical protein